MWKPWWRGSERASVEPFWRRLCSSGGRGWDRFSDANPVTHPCAPQSSPAKSTCRRMRGFTQYGVIITPLNTDVQTIRHCDSSALCTLDSLKSTVIHWNHQIHYFCCIYADMYLFVFTHGTFGCCDWWLGFTGLYFLLGNPLTKTILSYSSVMHLQPRGFRSTIRVRWGAQWPVNHRASSHKARLSHTQYTDSHYDI